MGGGVTQAQLERRCRYWQKILGLSDWTVVAGFARSEAMSDDGNQGECHVSFENREARIRILHPVDYPETSFVPQDWELTLVHELLHLHLDPIYRRVRGLAEELLEQTIQQVARSLIQLERTA